jgi:hypothetical protein
MRDGEGVEVLYLVTETTGPGISIKLIQFIS